MNAKKRIKPEDQYQLKSVSDPQLSKNGYDCVYIETTMCEEENTYSSHLFYINTNQPAETQQLTYGKGRNLAPRWSPDGSQIAFVSNRNHEVNQIFMLSMNGGEAKQLTNEPNGATNPIWSPDGKRIAFQSTVEKENLPEKNKDKPEPVEIERMKYKSDAKGLWSGDYQHIGVIDIASGEREWLTTGEQDYYLQCWSPDNQSIALLADLATDKDHSFNNDVYILDVESKQMENMTKGVASFSHVSWSPDGKCLGLIGSKWTYRNASLSRIWTLDVSTGELTCLTEEWDVQVGDYVVADFHQSANASQILWAEDSSSFYFLASDHGNTVLYFGTVEGAMYPALLEERHHIYGVSTGGTIDKAIVAISTPTNPGDLYLLNVTSGEKTRLTNINQAFFEETAVADAEVLQYQSIDGWELQGWLIKPINHETGEKYPLIVEIHGGPHMMYANTYVHEFQVLTAEGYAVLYTNPRGSHGYGQAFVDAVRGDYGGKDYEDIMTAVDYVLEYDEGIDRERLGVTGGSYGGFMTNWIVGHTNRFKAAVTQRSISNWISFYGVSDIGYYFTDWQIKSQLKDIEKLWKHSPLAFVEQVETPLLILHSENDLRCPIEQAEQFYIALKHHNKQAKFIRFPQANHELSRSGHPNLRMKRLHYIKNWFNEYV
ncbi:S9 family peptidase [Cytobacillus kochii]|uniref:S9 family peptidase n=1 Tax=Cytobacillus kochii TaxID=859143 RepID=UPI0025A1987F|nr:S9 family peptidase [Cytobacillus kochii]MDM5206922.1 S9 family peptidase [Cytobacillus kochii]